jgi:hypothetical protein
MSRLVLTHPKTSASWDCGVSARMYFISFGSIPYYIETVNKAQGAWRKAQEKRRIYHRVVDTDVSRSLAIFTWLSHNYLEVNHD